jgi:hypothetical protein
MLSTVTLFVWWSIHQSSPIDPTAFDRSVIESLRQIHDRGARLYNESKDYTSCQLLYEGALQAISPLLSHRPAVQVRIQETMKLIDRESTAKGRAFKLHELIEAVRADLKTGTGPRESAPVPQPRKPLPAPLPVPLAGVPTPVLTQSETTGRFTLDGKSLPDAQLQFVSLDRAKPTIVTMRATSEGLFRGPAIAPGRYVVTVDGPGVPPRYATTTDSSLVITIGPAPVTLNLKK